MDEPRIEQWWPHTDVRSKQWLRENLRAIQLPSGVVSAIAAAGGPETTSNKSEEIFSDKDWDFIEVQSEFVD